MKELKIRKILVPTDFSMAAWKAAELAVKLAARVEASVHLLHVMDEDYTLLQTDIPAAIEEYTGRLKEESYRMGFRERGVAVSYSLESGGVTHTILKTALDINADLVVVGKGGYDDNYAGTHACEIVLKSLVPVWLVPAGSETMSLKKILFPLRPLAGSMEKYYAIRGLLSAGQTELTLLSMRNPDSEQQWHTVTQLARLIGAQLEEDSIPYDMEYYFRDNRFAEHVLYFLKNRHYDFAVISTEREPYAPQFHLSPYIQTIIHHCMIPVLILYSQNKTRSDKKVSIQQKEVTTES
jgi:nucleotide-binding universal stress UspA family protein